MRRYDTAYASAMKRIEAGEIGTPVIFKSLGRDKEGPPLSYYHSNINGMLFYTNTIHDFDLARWMMRDEVAEVHAHTTSTIRPEVDAIRRCRRQRREFEIQQRRDRKYRIVRAGGVRVRRSDGDRRIERLDPGRQPASYADDHADFAGKQSARSPTTSFPRLRMRIWRRCRTSWIPS